MSSIENLENSMIYLNSRVIEQPQFVDTFKESFSLKVENQASSAAILSTRRWCLPPSKGVFRKISKNF